MQILIFLYYSRIRTTAVVLMAFILHPLMLDIDAPCLNCYSQDHYTCLLQPFNINKEGPFHVNSSILSGSGLVLIHYTFNNSRDNRCATYVASIIS